MSTNGEAAVAAERPIRAGVGSFGGEHPKADYFFWWFVTRRCDNHCRHCLRLGIGDRGEELDAAQARQLLLEFIDWLRQNKKTASVAFGGADPCCREDLPDLLRLCKDAIGEGVFVRPIGILANAHGMTAAYAEMMFDCGIRSFTISMDGLEAANDAQRGPGDFRESVRAIPILQKAGLSVSIKFTASKNTVGEFPAVRRLAAEHGITCVVPGRLMTEGGGKTCGDLTLTDDEWERFLDENKVEMPFGARQVTKTGVPPKFGPPRLSHGHFVIMAGGEFRPNRRGPALGHWPEDSIGELMSRLPMP